VARHPREQTLWLLGDGIREVRPGQQRRHAWRFMDIFTPRPNQGAGQPVMENSPIKAGCALAALQG
jgi:hypothetical protein